MQIMVTLSKDLRRTLCISQHLPNRRPVRQRGAKHQEAGCQGTPGFLDGCTKWAVQNEGSANLTPSSLLQKPPQKGPLAYLRVRSTGCLSPNKCFPVGHFYPGLWDDRLPKRKSLGWLAESPIPVGTNSMPLLLLGSFRKKISPESGR